MRTKHNIPTDPMTKSRAITTQLRAMAHEKGPNAKLPTVRELLKTLNTGRQTLDNVLSELEFQNVLCREHGSGIYVSPKIHHKTICILLDAEFLQTPGTSAFWNMIFGLLAKEAQRRSAGQKVDFRFHFMGPAQTPDSYPQDALLGMIESGQVHGALAVGTQHPIVSRLDECGIPVVSFAVNRGLCLVGVDNEGLIRLGAQSLIDQGCRKIAFWDTISPYRGYDPIAQRENLAVFRAAVVAAGLSCDERLAWPEPDSHHCAEEIGTHQEQGYRLAMKFFETPPEDRPDGIFIKDDMMTVGVMAAFFRQGVRPGDGVKIATHSNAGSALLFGYEDFLTRIQVNPAEIVEAMFHMLDQLMSDESLVAKSVMVCPKLIA